MRLRVVLGLVAQTLKAFSIAFLGPAALAVWDRQWESLAIFLVSAAFSGAVGALGAANFEPPKNLFREEAIAVVAATWGIITAVSAVPFLLVGLSLPDALFETMSGFTTTGATILTDFGVLDRPMFLWRAMTQWFGGVGVIALFVVVLPRLGIAGRQLFFAETSVAPEDAVSPRVRQAASQLWALYSALTAACIAFLMLTGMTLYEATTHALTALPAGGFSPNGESLRGYHNPGAEWVLVPFMFLGGASFPLQVRAIQRRRIKLLWQDDEFRYYLYAAVALSLVVAVLLAGGLPGGWELRAAFFQVVSLQTSTGFASEDFDTWSMPLKMVLIVAMIIGGCAGSAAGGAKVVRYLLTTRWVLRELRQALHPRAVLPVKYGDRAIPDQALRAVLAVVLLFFVGYVALALILVAGGMEPLDGMSASLACLGNIGPGYGVVGPMLSFGTLPDWMKLLLTFAMWVGRLEILTVLALLQPEAWRALRWNDRR
jgi:trk system potassium uptake protein TrkH